MTSADLLSIPQELLIRTLSKLDAVALARCALTCRRIHETLENSSLLKYTIQLHFNGIADSGISLMPRMSYPELIECLQRRRHEWMSPKWTLDMKLEMQDCYRLYDLVGGVLIRRSLSHLEITTLPNASIVDGYTIIKRALKDKFRVRKRGAKLRADE